MFAKRVRRSRMDGSLERLSREQLIARVLELEEYIRKSDKLLYDYMGKLALFEVQDMMKRGGRTR